MTQSTFPDQQQGGRPGGGGNGPQGPGGPQPHSMDAERAVLGALLLVPIYRAVTEIEITSL